MSGQPGGEVDRDLLVSDGGFERRLVAGVQVVNRLLLLLVDASQSAGKMKLPGEVRTISIPIGAVEKDKEYAYLVTLTVPARDAGKVRVVKAELFYDIPSMAVEGGSSMQSVVVGYTDDPQAVVEINGEVERAFDEVEIGRLVEELDKSVQGEDKKQASMLFDVLAERYRELGDKEMAAHYVSLKQKWSQSGGLTQEELNYTRHKSTQKRDSGVQLVDASSLI